MIYKSTLVGVLAILLSCQGNAVHPQEPKTVSRENTPIGEAVSELGNELDCMFRDLSGNYWFGSNGNGVYRYDGKKITHITAKNGLCSDFVWSILQDANGGLWFTTRDGICFFDGAKFADYTNRLKFAIPGNQTFTPLGLFFNRGDDIAYYNGKSFSAFSIRPENGPMNPNDNNRPYSVYSSLVDQDGNAWFGTQSEGVCRYDGIHLSYLKEKDLAGPAVRAIFQDRSGKMWFGNNGGGLYCYDGKRLRNITEERGLGNAEFLRDRRLIDKPGTLARVWAINEDAQGNLWVGTIDAGLWKSDGHEFKNYTTKEGLPGNSVRAIFKDKNNVLWFVTNGDAICKFDGTGFKKLEFKQKK